MNLDLIKHTTKAALIVLLAILSGWVSAEPKRAFTVEVVEAFVDIRTGAGKAYPAFYVAQRGEHMHIAKLHTAWYKVHLRSNSNREIIGWVHRDDIGKTLVAGSTMPTSEHPHFARSFNANWVANYALGRLEDADLMGINVGYRRLESLIFQVGASAFTGVNEQGWMANVQLDYQPFPRWQVSPFIAAGYGYLKREARGTLVLQEDESDQYLIAGAGFVVRLTKQYQLRLEYKQLNTLTSTDDNKELDSWRIGLSTYF